MATLFPTHWQTLQQNYLALQDRTSLKSHHLCASRGRSQPSTRARRGSKEPLNWANTYMYGPRMPTSQTQEGRKRSSTSKPLQLSTLFTTVLESNTLLREEIDQMEGRSAHTAFIMQSQNTGTGKSRAVVRQDVERRESGQLHSQSLPAKLLESSTVASTLSESSVLSQTSAEGSQRPTQFHSSLIASSKKKDITYTDSLGSEGISEETGTDESLESEEDDNKVQYSDSNLSLPQPYGSSNGSGDLHVPPPPLSITSVSTTDISGTVSVSRSENDPFASPGESTIDTMWDNFSIEEYAPPMKQREQKVKVPVSEPVQQAWRPRITIPEPFSMMVREAAKPQKKSRVLITAEQEKLERELQEEVECQRRFRALPVPATTYIPLHQLRREEHKQQAQLGCNKLVHSIKPFDFMKREDEKRQRKLEAMKEKMHKNTRKRVFKAKPTPHNILSPQVSEQLKEKEEYRKILIRVRSQEMLDRAELPKNMSVKGREYTVGNLRRERIESRQSGAFVTKEHTFHPKINHDIPDYDQLYFHFQQQMAVRRDVKAPTTPKPFLLQTSSVCPRKVQTQVEQAEHSKSRSVQSTSTPGGVLYSRSQPCQPVYSVQMTDTAKLRQSISERRLADEAENVVEEKEVRRSKREQQRELQDKVLQRVQSYDHSTWLQEKQRKKLQELRQQDQRRQIMYKKELQAMKQRVASQPLVFERVSWDAARRAAETKYTAALKKAGLSEDEIKALNKHVQLQGGAKVDVVHSS